jgi:4-hydroxy-4-methyl-2-oxoglutarate aldolase
MIKDPPLLRIRRNFQRPDKALLAAFDGVMTGWLVDAQFGRGALDYAIKPVFPGDAEMNRTFGTAITCSCGPDDNLALAAAMTLARPGDVVICATEGFVHGAVCGDLMAGMARNKGLAGLVTDGVLRDIAGLRDARLPVFSRGITPSSCVRSGPGSVGLPVVVGGRLVSPGDLVVGDEDGIVTVPLADLAAVRDRLAEVKAAEAKMRAQVKGGLADAPWMSELLASDRVEYLD